MFDTDKWQEIWGTLRQNKLRSFLTACGVFWGIFMLIVMLGFGDGLEKGVKKGMSGFATNAIYVWGQRTSMPYAGLQPGRSVNFDNGDVEAIRREIKDIEYFAPRNQLGGFRDGNNVSRGVKTGNFQVLGDFPEFQYIATSIVQEGRFLNALDIAERRKVCVIGKRVVELLFEPGEDPLGKQITAQGIPFTVVGVVRAAQSGERGDRVNNAIHLPFTTFQQAFNYGDRVNWMSLTVKPNAQAKDVEAAVKALIASRHKVDPTDAQALGSFNMGEEFGKIMGLFIGIKFLVWFVGTITLLAGVIGVSNIMLIVVKERTKEIGIRKAIGATPGSIVAQILQESIVLTSFAGFLGLMAGVALLEGVGLVLGSDSEMFSNPTVSIEVALWATAILIVTGALAGLLPARAAASINPVQALRAE